jgi:hypothetical protein
MDKLHITDAAQQHIRELCNKISIAHELDEDIQRELRGHMEDKLLVYLSGEEHITEEDAFVLVREHFGYAETIKSLFHDVYPRATRESVGRRIAAATLATLFIYFATRCVFQILQVGTFYLGGFWNLDNDSNYTKYWIVWTSLNGIVQILGAILLCTLFFRWERKSRTGSAQWFTLRSPRTLCAMIAAAVLVERVVPRISEAVVPSGKLLLSNEALIAVMRVEGILGNLLPSLAVVVAWLWWCDRFRGDMGRLALAAVSVFTVFLLRLPNIALPYVVLEFNNRWGDGHWQLYAQLPSIFSSDYLPRFTTDALIVCAVALSIYVVVWALNRRRLLFSTRGIPLVESV